MISQVRTKAYVLKTDTIVGMKRMNGMHCHSMSANAPLPHSAASAIARHNKVCTHQSCMKANTNGVAALTTTTLHQHQHW